MDTLLHGEPPAAAEPEKHEAEPVGPAPETAASTRCGSRRKLAALLAAILVIISVIVGVIWWGSTKNSTNKIDAPVNISELEKSDIQANQIFNFGKLGQQGVQNF